MFPALSQQARHTSWTGLAGSSISMALATILRQTTSQTIVVCPRMEDVDLCYQDTEFFLKLLGDSGPLLLPYPTRPSDLNTSRLPEPHFGFERIAALHALLESPRPVVVFVPLHALMQFTIPKEVLLKAVDFLEKGAEVDRDSWIRKLLASGYEQEPLVEEKGSLAVRGAIVDLFPPNRSRPVRVEFLGDVVESIREFDPTSQRSLESLDELILIPTREILFDPAKIEETKSRLKELADDLDHPRHQRASLEEALIDQRYTPTFDSLLPVFYPETQTFIDYVSPQARWIALDPFALEREFEQLDSDFKRVEEHLRRQGILAAFPQRLSASLKSSRHALESKFSVELSDIAVESSAEKEIHRFKISLHDDLRRTLIEKKRKTEPLAPLLAAVDDWKSSGSSILFVTASESDAKRLQALLARGIPDLEYSPLLTPEVLGKAQARPQLILGQLSHGFVMDSAKMIFVTEHEIFGERKQTIAREVSREDLFRSLSELSPGEPVVHIDHGVGIYRGLERITVLNISNDFLHLEYAGGDKLYLPIHRLDRIHRYIGNEGSKPHVDRLGNPAAWMRTRQKAKKAVDEMAEELLKLYASRSVAKGNSFSKIDSTYLSFEAAFPYEETRDQRKAIEEVSIDLESDRPMDRLVCGDVGFGKTEIALRAAFRVAMEGKQVAVLVPTTVLCMQHFETFKKRFGDYPLRIDFLSRFKPASDQKEVVRQIQDGTIDIVIGTHRLLSKDIAFKDLGLLVVDEEHRFGVKHKERIKQFRNTVDVLTLTATPIPRTLQMSVAGLRDLSVINTPPLDRKAIETYLCRMEDSVIRGAILKELERGGQIFFVHNRVETIAGVAQHLRKLVPELRMEVAHGQMDEKKLEEVMLRFARHDFNLLLCTTIIESGLDFPLANTILINRADRFGLAQLYQLRGRVGRSERSAYAYLLIPGEELISRDALKRLKVLKRFTELGSGLKIALHDLEIRGAGNLLGPDQSGHIAAVGFELYSELLDTAVKRLKGEKVEDEVEPEIQCHLPAFIPEDYVGDPSQRLQLYKKLSSLKEVQELENARGELIDRFGPIPPTVSNLLEVIELKIYARKIGASALRLNSAKPLIELTDRAAHYLERLLQLVKKDRRLALRPDRILAIDLRTGEDSVEETKKILKALH